MKFTITGVSKGDDMTRPEDLDLDEEDLEFEPNKFEYAVYIFAYDKDHNILDYEKLVKTFKDSEEAEKFAANLYDDPSELVGDLPEDAASFGIEVETVVDFGDHTENVETVYRREIELEK